MLVVCYVCLEPVLMLCAMLFIDPFVNWFVSAKVQVCLVPMSDPALVVSI